MDKINVDWNHETSPWGLMVLHFTFSQCTWKLTKECNNSKEVFLFFWNTNIFCEIFYFLTIIAYNILSTDRTIFPPHPLSAQVCCPPSCHWQCSAWPGCSLCWGHVLCHHTGTRAHDACFGAWLLVASWK